MKTLLVLDFDNTITDWNDTLRKKRADEIASMIFHLKYKFQAEPMILSLANRAHIFGTIHDSGSKELFNLVETMPIISEEDRGITQRLVKMRGETVARKNSTIMSVLKDPKFLNDENCIRAYKKVNSLSRISNLYRIKPHDIFFLDDNVYNIRFARHYHFHAFLVENNQSGHNIFNRMEQIKKILMDRKRNGKLLVPQADKR